MCTTLCLTKGLKKKTQEFGGVQAETEATEGILQRASKDREWEAMRTLRGGILASLEYFRQTNVEIRACLTKLKYCRFSNILHDRHCGLLACGNLR